MGNIEDKFRREKKKYRIVLSPMTNEFSVQKNEGGTLFPLWYHSCGGFKSEDECEKYIDVEIKKGFNKTDFKVVKTF